MSPFSSFPSSWLPSWRIVGGKPHETNNIQNDASAEVSNQSSSLDDNKVEIHGHRARMRNKMAKKTNPFAQFAMVDDEDSLSNGNGRARPKSRNTLTRPRGLVSSLPNSGFIYAQDLAPSRMKQSCKTTGMNKDEADSTTNGNDHKAEVEELEKVLESKKKKDAPKSSGSVSSLSHILSFDEEFDGDISSDGEEGDRGIIDFKGSVDRLLNKTFNLERENDKLQDKVEALSKRKKRMREHWKKSSNLVTRLSEANRELRKRLQREESQNNELKQQVANFAKERLRKRPRK